MKTMMGYELTTTFWEDFSIAEHFGIDAVKDTFNRAFSEWKDNYVYLTELALVTNWKIWQWYKNEPKNALVDCYYDCYAAVKDYAYDNLRDDELSFYLRVTD